ncbi:glycosyltransferase [Clostridium sp. BL-8]|uniref:glycosyltransferase family 2 protein n=1 Tax=Clostridium sp. BL-8 TaxID=349938 RepID=UPI00098CE38D|nr:glycosyltransferase [Clostridium sp. BL-8]OOM79443.1 putative glycosyltransferase EpsH [Clostridium sp. BL-8]
MRNIAITLIIPVYNGGKYLAQMLESVYNQTFKDFEIVIVNDGSNDNSEEIIFNYLEKHSNIKYLKQENKGQAEARNKALGQIRGKYTLFLDADDFIEFDMLEKMYNKSEINFADIAICAYKKVYDFECKDREKIVFDSNENRIYTNVEVMEMMLDGKVQGYLCNKMFLSKNILENEMHFEKGRIIEDLLPVFKLVSTAQRIIFINEPLYNYRQHLDSTLHKKIKTLIDDRYFACTEIYKYARKNTDIKDSKCFLFMLKSQIAFIYDALSLKVKCGKEFYKKYTIEDFSIYKILFDLNISFKHKIKFILFNIRVLHFYYKVKKALLE